MQWSGLVSHLQPSVTGGSLIFLFQLVLNWFYTSSGCLIKCSCLKYEHKSWHFCCILPPDRPKRPAGPTTPSKLCKASPGGTSSLCKHAADATAQPSSCECRIMRRKLMGPFSPVIPCNLGKFILGSKYITFPEKLWWQFHQRHNFLSQAWFFSCLVKQCFKFPSKSQRKDLPS